MMRLSENVCPDVTNQACLKLAGLDQRHRAKPHLLQGSHKPTLLANIHKRAGVVAWVFLLDSL
jgi:hypothetical protein